MPSGESEARSGAESEGSKVCGAGRRLRGTKKLIPRPTTARGALVELVVIVALAIGLALLIQAFVVKPYQIPSGSMEPTLKIGQRVLVDRVLYHFRDPHIGDMVVFHPPVGAETGSRAATASTGEGTKAACDEPTPEESDTNFIKRIVAGPGDRLSVHDGHPVVNGVEANEDFIRPCRGGTDAICRARSRSHPAITS